MTKPIPQPFTPPKREEGEGLLTWYMRIDKERKRWEGLRGKDVVPKPRYFRADAHHRPGDPR